MPESRQELQQVCLYSLFRSMNGSRWYCMVPMRDGRWTAWGGVRLAALGSPQFSPLRGFLGKHPRVVGNFL